MSIKFCAVCEYEFKDGEAIVAVVASRFHTIPSEINFAIEKPTKCIEIIHSECYDWPDYESYEGAIEQ